MMARNLVKWATIASLFVLFLVGLHYGRILMLGVPPIGGPVYTRADCQSTVIFEGEDEQAIRDEATAFMDHILMETVSQANEIIMPWVRMIRGTTLTLLSFSGSMIVDGPGTGTYRLHLFYSDDCHRKNVMTGQLIASFKAAHPGVRGPRKANVPHAIEPGSGCPGGPQWTDGDQPC